MADDEPMDIKIARITAHIEAGSPVNTGDSPTLRLTHEGERCTHIGILTIDESKHTVICEGCGRIVDPFDALLVIASSERRMQHEYDTIIRERRAQRGFYELKRTVRAQKCRHTRTYELPNGDRKCVRCDTCIPAADRLPLKEPADAD